jgi:NTP pyrophosphatase (non-canonical NTP hydrolase)
MNSPYLNGFEPTCNLRSISIYLSGMSNIEKLTDALVKFRDERDWEQFHNPKDLAIALNIEAGELLENYLWKTADEADVEKVKEELADVMAYALLIAKHYNFNVEEIVLDKIAKNALKYPTDKAKGNAKKYNEL